jgi:phosphatidylserine/phosphatidylglycerophosphate/cardiolipin synthase-like enzyme
MRLHVRAIVRDRKSAFVGSQSLRKLELDERREVGLILRARPIVKELQRVFEEDWAKT